MPKRDEALAVFGQNVAKFRNKRGFSQDKLAEEASLDRTYLSGIERGVRNPGIGVATNLTQVLKVSIEGSDTPLFGKTPSTSTVKLIKSGLSQHESNDDHT